MNLLAGIAPDRGEWSIRKAAGAILEAAEQRQFTRPWSLAELEMDLDDLEWLSTWAQGARSGYLRGCLDSWQDAEIPGHQFRLQAATGLLLMALISETGRRHSSEGALWPKVLRHAFKSDPPECLFVNGQPSLLLKEALESAARSAGLRHVFGVEGVHNWFRSVHLQFGFTKSGFEQRLPEWLAGQTATVAVEALLGSKALVSESFNALWDALRNYRRQSVSEQRCRAIISASPWVLSEWADDLMRCARKRIELGTSTGRRDVDAPPPVFLAPARLVWEPFQPPRFLTRVVNLASYNLTSATYRLLVDGQAKARLLLQPDGCYHVEPGEELSLEARHPVAHAELVDASGTVEHVTDLQLWDATEDVTLFKLPSGVVIEDPYAGLSTAGEYALLCPSDLELRPAGPQCALAADGAFLLRRLPSDWQLLGVALLLGENELWSARTKSQSRQLLPEWVSGVRVTRRQSRVRLGEPLELDITHPATATVTFVRVNGQTCEFGVSNDWQTRIGPIALDGELGGGKLTVTLGVRNDGRQVTVRRETIVSVDGVAARSAGGWTPLSPRDHLDVRAARTTSFRIIPPQAGPAQSVRDWGILEGDTFVRRVSAYPSPIEGLAGLGGHLRVRYGPYNSVEEPMEVAACVTDRGIIRTVNGVDHGSQFAVIVEGHIEPEDGGHALVWCAEGGGFSTFRPSSFHMLTDSNATVWTCPRPQLGSGPWAIGAAYRGERLGVWWTDDWHLRMLADGLAAPGELAAMLRWLRLPVLADAARAGMAALVSEAPRAVTEAWVRSAHTPSGLVHGPMDDAWLGAVRTLLTREPGLGPWLCGIFDALDETGSATPDAFDVAARELMRVDPILMGRVLFAAACRDLVPTIGKLGVAGILEGIICRLAGSVANAPVDKLDAAVDELVLQVAADVGVGRPADSGFVMHGLVERAIRRMGGRSAGSEVDEVNVRLALGIDPFRRLLAIHLLRDKILPAFK